MNKPNVLLVCVDHWPGSLLGSAGHPCIMTPTLDQMAANGTRFDSAYSAAPTCIPARRSLMTGTSARGHGDRVFSETMEMPAVPTIADAFSDAGYQTYAVGKLHVYPQRNRIGFDDVLLNEEGRHHLENQADDYELFLAEHGHPGEEYSHGMPTTDYLTRPWHLDERLHPTNWTAREMCKTIIRRDPTRPAFWYLSFTAPHPPLVPPRDYLDMYRDAPIPQPHIGEWATEFESLPYMLKARQDSWYATRRSADGRTRLSSHEMKLARQAFYATCTHVDHQLRMVLGTLREQGLQDNTIVAFTSDHGDMLGNHGQVAKGLMYEDSARVPLIVVPTSEYKHLGHDVVDDRLVELADIMPTLLEMADVPIPPSVEGHSLLSEPRRDHLYGEHYEGEMATRMLRGERFKLVYYAAGNRVQLFDILDDPQELNDLSGSPEHSEVLDEMLGRLKRCLYGSDSEWVKDGKLVGLPDRQYRQSPNRSLTAQRGWRTM